MKASLFLLSGVLLATAVAAIAEPALASCEVERGTLPYTGPILGIKVGSYNTSKSGGGYIEITGERDGKEVKAIMSLYTGLPDNNAPAFEAFYLLAQLAYEKDYTVEITNVTEQGPIYQGCAISLIKGNQPK
jgi:hypothetical protein